MTNNIIRSEKDEEEIKMLIENWAKAVRERDLPNILKFHSHDIVMFDVPPPFQSLGIDAYKKTWGTFFKDTKPGIFNMHEITVIADDHIGFCFATMHCEGTDNGVDFEEIHFRLTVCLTKINSEWMIIHEHHSVPAE